MKRAISPDGAGAKPSLYADDRRHKRQLFRPKPTAVAEPQQQPGQEPDDMSPLTDYILTHEDAFQNTHRLFSLYSDHVQQSQTNPVGYKSNIAAWITALSNATRAGVVPSHGATHSLLHIRCSEELRAELNHPAYGSPVCLPAIFKDAQQQKEMMTFNDFLYSKHSIYSSSWIPSPWKIVQWGLRATGFLQSEPENPYDIPIQDYVIVKNVELAAVAILKQMQEVHSTMDRVISKADFMQRFAHVLSPTAALTAQDLEIVLVYLARDRQAIRYNAEIIKFKLEHEKIAEPVTQEDEALIKLRNALAVVNGKINPLMEKITLADAAAREAVAAKAMVRAKAALRSKKLAEKALEHHTGLAIQLENIMDGLRNAADQVGIVEAMRLGAEAMKDLNEQMGGAEGVQLVVDTVNEQMALADEISGIMNEDVQPLDEGEIEDEFEALEKAEREKKAKATAAKMATLAEADRKLSEHEKAERRRQTHAQMMKDAEVEQASVSFSNLSFMQQDDEEMEGVEERVPMAA